MAEQQSTPVEVLQCDRDRAADYLAHANPSPSGQVFAATVRAGGHPNATLAEAFARHRLAALERAVAEERLLREALQEIRDIQPRDYEGPEFDSEASKACPECQRYEGHPIQQGICTEHRKPFEAQRRHEAFEEDALGYRCKGIARDALAASAIRSGDSLHG